MQSDRMSFERDHDSIDAHSGMCSLPILPVLPEASAGLMPVHNP